MTEVLLCSKVHDWSIPILMYHSISDQSGPAFHDFCVPPSLFDEQMAAMREEGYQSLTVGELTDSLAQGRPLPKKPLAITVDDAYEDFVLQALPTLQKYQMKATLYVSTAYVGETSRWLTDEGEEKRRILTWGQLSEVAAAGVECGAHSHRHVQMDLLSVKAAAREASLSKGMLEDQLGIAVGSFAYPFGYENSRTRQAVRQAGFLNACGVRDLPFSRGDNRFCIPRLTVTPEMTPKVLGSLLQRERTSVGTVRSFARSIASGTLRRAGVKKRGTRPAALDC